MKELCFNLWYYLDRRQNITAIAAKAYELEGSDAQNASALLAFSNEDYHLIPPFEIERVHYSMLKRIGVEGFFSPEFERIVGTLPKGTLLPEEKLFYATPLFDFGGGFTPAEIGNGFITERKQDGATV